MVNTLFRKTERTVNHIEMAQQNFVSLVSIITNLPFSYLWVATSRRSGNLFGDLIL